MKSSKKPIKMKVKSEEKILGGTITSSTRKVYYELISANSIFFRHLQFCHSCRSRARGLHPIILTLALYRYVAYFKELERTNISAEITDYGHQFSISKED